MPGKDAPNQQDVLTVAVASLISRRQCSFPGIVTAAGTDGRVEVQPAIRIASSSGQQTTPKPVLIPVQWPSWGDVVIQGVLQVGDEVRVQCQDKNWLPWLVSGGVVDDTGVGGRASGYAVAIPVQMSEPRRPQPLAQGELLRIGRKDSLTTIVMGVDGAITLQATEVSLTAGTGLAQFLTDLQTAIAGWAPVPNDGGAALKTALTAWLLLVPPTGGAPPS